MNTTSAFILNCNTLSAEIFPLKLRKLTIDFGVRKVILFPFPGKSRKLRFLCDRWKNQHLSRSLRGALKCPSHKFRDTFARLPRGMLNKPWWRFWEMRLKFCVLLPFSWLTLKWWSIEGKHCFESRSGLMCDCNLKDCRFAENFSVWCRKHGGDLVWVVGMSSKEREGI